MLLARSPSRDNSSVGTAVTLAEIQTTVQLAMAPSRNPIPVIHSPTRSYFALIDLLWTDRPCQNTITRPEVNLYLKRQIAGGTPIQYDRRVRVRHSPLVLQKRQNFRSMRVSGTPDLPPEVKIRDSCLI